MTENPWFCKYSYVKLFTRHYTSPHISHYSVARCVRCLSIQGARRFEPGGVLKQYVEDSNQAERSSDRHMAHRSRNSVKYGG